MDGSVKAVFACAWAMQLYLVRLRSHEGLTASGIHVPSYGGSGGGHPPVHPRADPGCPVITEAAPQSRPKATEIETSHNTAMTCLARVGPLAGARCPGMGSLLPCH